MMFLDFLKSLFNVFCSPSKSSPSESSTGGQQPYPQRPSTPGESNAYYIDLRERASEEGRRMARCFEESHLLYSRGDGAGAKSLSNEGKEHQRMMERLNKEASDWIFLENNKDSKAGEIDLHGLYVKEALERTDRAIQDAKERGDAEVRLIVGKGLHSNGGSAKIRPAVEELIQKHHLVAALDTRNSGVLIVQINSPDNQGIGVKEISQYVDRDERCIMM